MNPKLTKLKPVATLSRTPTVESKLTQPISRTPNPPIDGKEVTTQTIGEKMIK